MMSAPRKRGPPPAPRRRAAAPAVDFRRGDILWIDCDPSIGVEPRKTRTCVVVSNDIANRFGQAVTVIPTQSYSSERAARAYVVDLRSPRSTLAEPRVANASMVMTYDRSRVVSRAGRVSAEAQERVDAALQLHLGLNGG
jgi:mRNA interferase MazF